MYSYLRTPPQYYMCIRINIQIRDKVSGVSLMNTRLASRYRREMQLRKRLHNTLVELRGNIRVLCRVRPPILEDGCGPSPAPDPTQVVVEVDGEDDGLVRVLSRSSWKSFDLDKVFGPSSTQEQVYVHTYSNGPFAKFKYKIIGGILEQVQRQYGSYFLTSNKKKLLHVKGVHVRMCVWAVLILP